MNQESRQTSIFDVLDYGYIVFGDEELGSIITWNGSNTFLWWNMTRAGWSNEDIKTLYLDDSNPSIYQIEKVAQEWHSEVMAAVEDDSEDEKEEGCEHPLGRRLECEDCRDSGTDCSEVVCQECGEGIEA